MVNFGIFYFKYMRCLMMVGASCGSVCITISMFLENICLIGPL